MTDDRGRTAADASLARALRLAGALQTLLDDERRATAVAEPAALASLAARKRHLLASLEALQPALGETLARLPAEDGERRELLARLEACREANLENGIAVGTAAHHVRSALALLRATLALDDLTLYDEHGGLRTRREQRRLGQA